MLYQYPNLYVDVSWIDWYLPRAEFHGFLKRRVDAGCANRIMFGSDQMQWPDTIGLGIEGIESAPFLNLEQKRDILCRNATRFLRLDPNLCR
jgi:predicted TIM-barrel fold metal-dependent hydrolase